MDFFTEKTPYNQWQQSFSVSHHLIPYAILLLNCLLFKLLRSLVAKLLTTTNVTKNSTSLKLFIEELISTCELCADCAELNIVYEKHGPSAYGASLFLLTYLWCDTFGEAQTSPAYLAEDYFLSSEGGSRLLVKGATWARFVGQFMAVPLAGRLTGLYWQRQLISEHSLNLQDTQHCKSSLATTNLKGFLVELVCCFLCRLVELLGYKLLETRRFGRRLINLASSFISTLLVVLALDLSGGYFNPVLAAALEFGCQGIGHSDHALVFWLGPVLGHLGARFIFKRYVLGPALQPELSSKSASDAGKRSTTRSESQRRRRKRRAD